MSSMLIPTWSVYVIIFSVFYTRWLDHWFWQNQLSQNSLFKNKPLALFCYFFLQISIYFLLKIYSTIILFNSLIYCLSSLLEQRPMAGGTVVFTKQYLMQCLTCLINIFFELRNSHKPQSKVIYMAQSSFYIFLS